VQLLSSQKAIIRTALALSLLLLPFAAKAQCIDDLELLTNIELGVEPACSIYGEIQQLYRSGHLGYSSMKLHGAEYLAYTHSRQAFYLLISELDLNRRHEEWPENFDFVFRLFQRSLYSYTLSGTLEGQRGAFYQAAYWGMVARYGRGELVIKQSLGEALFEIDDFGNFVSSDDFIDFAICFWEFDIPSLPIEVVLESELISSCMESGKYDF